MRDLSTNVAIFFLLTFLVPLAYARLDYPTATANHSTIWINNNSSLWESHSNDDGSPARIILLQTSQNDESTSYGLGFYCTNASSFSRCEDNAYLLAIFMVNIGWKSPAVWHSHTVWYANRDHPVGENATLAFTSVGDLSLSDAEGTLVWSSITSSKGVQTLSLQPIGNLILADAQNVSVWQSFDHPADILVLGQTLKHGMRLFANTSFSNSTRGPYYMQMEQTGLILYADDPVTPQPYWSASPDVAPSTILDIPYVLYTNGSLDLFISNHAHPDHSVPIPSTTSLSYLQLGVDGKIKVYSGGGYGVTMLVDLQAGFENTCSMLTICGPCGICSSGECSCGLLNYYASESQLTEDFSPIVNNTPSLGCTSQHLLVSNASTTTTLHFLHLDDFYYPNISFLIEDCQQRCSQNCSCTAVIFLSDPKNGNLGTCFPVSRLYTITQNIPVNMSWKSIVLIRMQSIVTSPPLSAPSFPPREESPKGPRVNLATILYVVLSSVTVAGLLLLGSIFVYRRRRKRKEAKDDMFATVPGLIPTRFSFKELKAATKNFSKILGAGGFGSVFLGDLPDGSKVAVKRLESANQGQKEFQTEVCIIGSIHHVNLVRLRGFCAEKEHRMLVYEYMPRGSLEKWLFHRTNNRGTTSSNDDDDDDAGNSCVLDWGLRFNIALGTARGLAYLHEECSERIIHLDIKPPNILLDDHFVAKVSDFGLSKLMSREQSRVVTRMRGTPGYLAPEWLHASVTEKADVYSFGILLFEITSGRKSVDMSVEESEVRHIPVWASRMVEEGRMMDVIDAQLLQEFDREQAETMVKVALWCIRENPNNRPSMGTVVQMLEGVVECPDPPLNAGHHLNTANRYTRTTFDSHNSDSAMESVPLDSILSSSR